MLALLNYDLVKQADDFQVFNDVRVLRGDEHEEELFHRKIHVSDALRLNMRALFS